MNKREVIYYDVSPFASVSAKAIPSNNLQPFSDVRKLFRENQEYRSIQTCEHNYTVLDGTHDGFAYDENIALWSDEQSSLIDLTSGDFGFLPTPVTLEVTFGGLQSSPGIAFYFDRQNNVYADEVNVKWYNSSTILSDETFYPDGAVYSFNNKVEYYNRVRIEFTRLNMPGRRLRVEAVLFGIVRVFGEDSIESLTVNEGLDPTGRTVNINSASFVINAKTSIPYIFLKRQPLYIRYEGLRMGTYYIDKSKKYADGRYSIEAIDKIGVLDMTDEFLGGMYEGMPAQAVIRQIIGGLFDVEVDAALQSVPVSGWLPIMKKREALAQVALAIGAIVDATRTDAVRIRKPPANAGHIIPKDKVYQSSSVDIEFPYTGVEVIEHNYTPGAVKELHKDKFEGEKLVKFSEAATNLTIANGAIISNGVNWAKITGSGIYTETILSGRPYVDNQSSVVVKDELMIEGTQERMEKIDRGYLINSGNAQAVAQRLYDYYRRRNAFDGDFLMDINSTASNLSQPEIIGDTVQIAAIFDGDPNSTSSSLTGQIEKLTLHLGAANIKARGVIRGE